MVMATSGKPVASAKPDSGCPCVEGGRAQWQGRSRPVGWGGRGCLRAIEPPERHTERPRGGGAPGGLQRPGVPGPRLSDCIANPRITRAHASCTALSYSISPRTWTTFRRRRNHERVCHQIDVSAQRPTLAAAKHAAPWRLPRQFCESFLARSTPSSGASMILSSASVSVGVPSAPMVCISAASGITVHSTHGM